MLIIQPPASFNHKFHAYARLFLVLIFFLFEIMDGYSLCLLNIRLPTNSLPWKLLHWWKLSTMLTKVSPNDVLWLFVVNIPSIMLLHFRNLEKKSLTICCSLFSADVETKYGNISTGFVIFKIETMSMNHEEEIK